MSQIGVITGSSAYLLGGALAVMAAGFGLVVDRQRGRREHISFAAWLAVFILWPVFMLAWSVNAWKDRP